MYFKKDDLKNAIDCYDKAIEIKNDYYKAYHNKGNAYSKMNDSINAIKCFDAALKIKSDYLPALKSRNSFYINQKKFDKALPQLDKLLIYEPDNIDFYVQKADILSEINNHTEAIKNYKTAYTLNPDHPFLLGDMIHAKSKICDWDNIDDEIKRLENKILEKNKSSAPFAATAIFDSLKFYLKQLKFGQNNFKMKMTKFLNM